MPLKSYCSRVFVLGVRVCCVCVCVCVWGGGGSRASVCATTIVTKCCHLSPRRAWVECSCPFQCDCLLACTHLVSSTGEFDENGLREDIDDLTPSQILGVRTACVPTGMLLSFAGEWGGVEQRCHSCREGGVRGVCLRCTTRSRCWCDPADLRLA